MSHVLMKWILYELKEFDKSINKLGNAHGLLISNYLRSLIRPAHERVDMYSADLCLDVCGKWVPWRLRDLIFLFSFLFFKVRVVPAYIFLCQKWDCLIGLFNWIFSLRFSQFSNFRILSRPLDSVNDLN